jgi:hypothetical protein
MHKARIIDDPNQLLEKITHPHPGEQELLRKKFVHQNQVEDLGVNGIAFSVICCDDPKTISRHTIEYAHRLSPEDLERVIEKHLKNNADSHEASGKNTEHFKRLTKKK